MANRKIANTFLATAAFSATSSAGGFSMSNVDDRTSPQKAWRSTVATDSRLVINMSAVQTSVTVYMDWVNFSSFKFQESADGSTGWTDIGTTETVTQDPVHGVYRIAKTIIMDSKQYLGIWIPTQTPVDNAAYFRIGTLTVPTNVVELNASVDVEFPWTMSLPDTHIVKNRFPTGAPEKIKIGNLQPMIFSLAIKSDSENQAIAGADVLEIADLLRAPEETLFFDFNFGNNWQAYLVTRAGAITPSIASPNTGTIDWGTLSFEVIT